MTRPSELLGWRAEYGLEDGIRHALERRRRLLELEGLSPARI